MIVERDPAVDRVDLDRRGRLVEPEVRPRQAPGPTDREDLTARAGTAPEGVDRVAAGLARRPPAASRGRGRVFVCIETEILTG
jgi:hypothetical protein